MSEHRLDVHPLISHHFPIDRAGEAYQLITGKNSEPYLGVLLTYPSTIDVDSLEAGRRVDLKPVQMAASGPANPGVGVLGAGNYASAVFLPAVQHAGGARLVGIASASGLTARQAASRFGFNYAATSIDQLVSDPDIQVMAVLTRHNQHAAQVLAALHAGKHVYCEKPLATAPEDLKDLADFLQKDARTLLTVGYNRRFAPLAVQLKEFLSGSGEPFAAHYRVNAGYIPLTHWTQDPLVGGGRIIGEACHFVAFLTWLAGTPPETVTAHGIPNSGRYQDDNVVLTFTFPDGSLGTVTYLANGDKAFPKERVEVFSAGRVGVLDDFRSLELVSSGKRRVIRSNLRQDKGHQAAWKNFLASVQQGVPPIPYDQLFGVSQAAFCALTALKTGEKTGIELL